MANFDVRPLAPTGPGSAVEATVAAGATSAEVAFRTNTNDSAGRPLGMFPAYVTFKATSTAAGPGYHIVIGPPGVGAPTDADIPINDTDGWVRVLVRNTDTVFRIKSEASSAGSVAAYLS
jgi:hypothetical protein